METIKCQGVSLIGFSPQSYIVNKSTKAKKKSMNTRGDPPRRVMILHSQVDITEGSEDTDEKIPFIRSSS